MEIDFVLSCELSVYDVANRESFDALPRWYSELETYVSESVVKIVVGNKVDKVRRLPSYHICIHIKPTKCHHRTLFALTYDLAPARTRNGMVNPLGVLSPSPNTRGGGLRRAHEQPFRRGERQDVGRCARCVPQRRRAHHRHAGAMGVVQDEDAR